MTDRKRKRSESPPSPRTPPPRPSLASPLSSPVPTPPREPFPLCLICLDDDALHPDYGLECNHYCHLACLRQYLATNISFCPDVSCRVPISLVDGVPVEPRYLRVDPAFSESLSLQLVDSLVAADGLVRSMSFSCLSLPLLLLGVSRLPHFPLLLGRSERRRSGRLRSAFLFLQPSPLHPLPLCLLLFTLLLSLPGLLLLLVPLFLRLFLLSARVRR